jgi:hypothetical protein
MHNYFVKFLIEREDKDIVQSVIVRCESEELGEEIVKACDSIRNAYPQNDFEMLLVTKID